MWFKVSGFAGFLGYGAFEFEGFKALGLKAFGFGGFRRSHSDNPGEACGSRSVE